MLAMSENSVFVGKRGNHPENCGQQTVPRKKKTIRPKFQDIFNKTVQHFWRKQGKGPLLIASIQQTKTSKLT